jgi:hypothetical protein
MVKAEKNQKIKVIAVDASINRSWYTIDTTNNSFTLYTNGTPSSITLPKGYYDVNSLKSQLSLLLTGWIIVYNTLSNNYTFTPPNNGITYKFTFINRCCELLGFLMTDTPTGVFASPFTPNLPLKLNREFSVFIHTDLPTLKYASIDNMQNTQSFESNILLKIPIQAAPFDNIVFVSNGNDNYSCFLSSKQINSLHIWVTDETNRSLILPYDWTF